MQMAQGKASTSCHEAIREEKKASKRLKLDREHKERDKSWIWNTYEIYDLVKQRHEWFPGEADKPSETGSG